jgi:hypothetical protein
MNFGFVGYGAHQMLALLRFGDVRRVVGTRAPALVVYTAIPDHIRRSLGQYDWTIQHPCFALAQGDVVYRGRFDQVGPRGRAWNQVRKSYLYRAARSAADRTITQAQLDFFVALVDSSRAAVEAEWPGTPFRVVYIDSASVDSERQIAALERRGIAVVRASSILPGLVSDRERYTLSAADRHLNPDAHRRIAARVAEWVDSTVPASDRPLKKE